MYSRFSDGSQPRRLTEDHVQVWQILYRFIIYLFILKENAVKGDVAVHWKI